MEPVFQLLEAIATLEPGLRDYLYSVLKTTKPPKNEILIREGDIARTIGFIEKGMVRGYQIEENGDEFTSWFMTAGDVFISIKSFLTQTPAYENLVALKPCVIHSITYDQYRFALKNWPSFHQHRAELLQKYYLQSEDRHQMRRQGAYEKVTYFIKNYPTLESQVLDKHIASFLNLEPHYYSEIKKQYKKNNPKG